jgi:hypothetical protein
MSKKKMAGLSCLASRAWWDAAGTRAIRTFAQAAGGALIANTIWDIDLKVMIGVAVMPAIGSLLASLEGLPEIEDGGK